MAWILRRSNLPAGVKTPSWDARVEKRKKEDAIKLLEKTLKDEKLAEEERLVHASHFLHSHSLVGVAWRWCELEEKEGRKEEKRELKSSKSDPSLPLSLFRFSHLHRKKTITKERKLRVEEKKRLEEMAARMSAKKLQRMKKVSFNPSFPPSSPSLASFGPPVQATKLISTYPRCVLQRLGRSKKVNG